MKTKVITVEKLDPYWSWSHLKKWLGEVYHEIGHHAPELKDMLPLMIREDMDFQSLKGKLMNVVEDVRNEFNNYGEYPGRDEALSWTQGYYCTQGLEHLKGKKLDKDMQLFVDVMSWVYTYRGLRQLDLVAPAMEMEAYAKRNYSHLSPDLDAMVTADDVLDIVNKILEESPDHDKEEEDEKSQKGEGEGEPSEEEGDEESDGSGGGSPEDEDGDGAVEEVSYSDLMGHAHSDTDDEKGDSYTKIKYDHTEGSYIPWDKMKVELARDHTKPRWSDDDQEATEFYKEGSSLASIARRLFQSRTQSMKTHNHKAGRLDKRDLYRIPTGSVDVFTRKSAAPDPKGTALFILTDASGSMSGRKYPVTTAAVALLNDAVAPLGVPTEIAAFTENSRSGCEHYIIKKFNEHRKAEDIIEDYAKIEGELCQNADGESVMWAAKELAKRPEPRKILLVLSDGMPSADNYGDCDKYTKDVIQHVSKFVECYGIGIMSKAVARYYPEYTVIKDTKNLDQALLDVIKKKIFT
jgi:cobalamin biosynthesis protein CobT